MIISDLTWDFAIRTNVSDLICVNGITIGVEGGFV